VLVATVLVSYGAAKLARRAWWSFVAWQGMKLNQDAWEAGFRERGLPVPEQGPRDGYWGSRIAKHVTDPVLGWVLPELHIPDLLEVDANGFQYAPEPGAPGTRILIVGASTAFGGYASTIGNTYFSLLGRELEGKQRPVAITVLATGAWKSEQELKAIEAKGLATNPQVVVFLNGLNDITNGANAHVRYGVETKTLDGSRWHPLYHEHDYPERVRVYLANMREARDRLRALGIDVVFALQPSLFEKKTRSPLEEEVERGALVALGSEEDLRRSYESLRQGLAALANEPGVYFADCSRAFDGETATVFTDAWHFSDVGHRLLAHHLADQLAPWLGGGGES
jgi:lysophospholipase L1-like esterase